MLRYIIAPLGHRHRRQWLFARPFCGKQLTSMGFAASFSKSIYHATESAEYFFSELISFLRHYAASPARTLPGWSHASVRALQHPPLKTKYGVLLGVDIFCCFFFKISHQRDFFPNQWFLFWEGGFRTRLPQDAITPNLHA